MTTYQEYEGRLITLKDRISAFRLLYIGHLRAQGMITYTSAEQIRNHFFSTLPPDQRTEFVLYMSYRRCRLN